MAKNKHGKHRNGGRTTPKGTRPSHLRLVPEAASVVDQLIDDGVGVLLAEADPISVETWGSGMLRLAEQMCRDARRKGQSVPPFEGVILDRCRTRGDLPALVVATAFAAVAPEPLAAQAQAVCAAVRARLPHPPDWLGRVGQATPTLAFVGSDVYGDQQSLIVAFVQDGETDEHALVVLVDHNLSGQAKDAFIVADVDEVVATWNEQSARDDGLALAGAPVEEVFAQLRDAMAMADLFNGDDELRSDAFADHRAIIWARLARAGFGPNPSPPVDTPPWPEPQRRALIAEFLASPDGDISFDDVDVEILVHYLVGLRCDYGDSPLRWSPTVVESVLLDLAPRKLLIDPDEATAFLDVMRFFIRFAATRTGLAKPFVDETIDALDGMGYEFLQAMGDPSAAGPAKALLGALAARGVDIGDIDALRGALDEGVVTHLPALVPPRAVASVAEAPVEVVAAAAASVALARIRSLAEFYGAGRKLTGTGHPTLADGRALVAALGTADRIDEVIGDKTFKTRSAGDLPELSFMVRWAVAAGALRKQHGKYLATKSWVSLDARPLKQWMKLADAMLSLGPLAGWAAGSRWVNDRDLVDQLVPPILAMLTAQATPYDDVLDFVCSEIDLRYTWPGGWMAEAENRRLSFSWDLDRFAKIFGWAGIVERVDAVEKESGLLREMRLMGGTLVLTRLGRWWVTGQ